MLSRSLVILSALVSFGLGYWGGRQLTHQQAIESDAVAPGMTSPAPEVRDSAAALRARIEATPTVGLVALYEELSDRRWPDPDSLLAYRSLLERCLREDKEGLMSSFEKSSGERRARELVQVWLEVDADGLMGRILADEATATQLLRREVAFAAPSEFLTAAVAMTDRGPSVDHAIGSAILCLSGADPLAALTWLDRFALREDFKAYDRIAGTNALQEVASVHAEVAARYAAIDPEAALVWAQARTTPAGKKSVATAVLASWASADPDAAGLALAGLGESSGLRSVSIAKAIAATDPELAYRWLAQYQNQQVNTYVIESLSRHIRDSSVLRRIESQMTDSDTRDTFRRLHLTEWDDRPFEEGLDWALSAPAESQKSALNALAIGIENVPYDDAVKLAEKIPDAAMRESFLLGLRSNLYNKDPIRLFEIVRASGDENELASTIEWAAYTHAIRSDFPPEEVYAWTREAGGGLRGDLYEELAQRYYREDPVKAQAWIDSLENGYEKSNLLRGLANEMSQRAPETALAWAEKYPDPELREEVISSVAWHLAEKRPEKAFDLALNHPNSSRESFMSTLTRSVRSWARRDPAAARAARAGAQALTERERQSLSTWIYAP
jgi:hypothetical protein